MNNKVKKVGLIGRIENENVVNTVKWVICYLKSRGITSLVSKEVVEATALSFLEATDMDTMGRSSDLIIVVGGDGSLLGASRDMADYDVPLVGINRGHLGFLTDINPSELDKQLDLVLNGDIVEEERFLLEGEIVRNGEIVVKNVALNDVVLQPGQATRMLEFQLFINNQFVCTQKADGLITSTPTGSTAYSLSAGGPILTPTLDAIAIVPINPHTLSNRPIVVTGDSDISITVTHLKNLNPQVTFDGQKSYTLEEGDVIRVKKKEKKLKLIHLPDYNYYEICRKKLGWTNSFQG